MVLLKISNISGILKMGCTMTGPIAETNDRKNISVYCEQMGG